MVKTKLTKIDEGVRIQRGRKPKVVSQNPRFLSTVDGIHKRDKQPGIRLTEFEDFKLRLAFNAQPPGSITFSEFAAAALMRGLSPASAQPINISSSTTEPFALDALIDRLRDAGLLITESEMSKKVTEAIATSQTINEIAASQAMIHKDMESMTRLSISNFKLQQRQFEEFIKFANLWNQQLARLHGEVHHETQHGINKH